MLTSATPDAQRARCGFVGPSLRAAILHEAESAGVRTWRPDPQSRCWLGPSPRRAARSLVAVMP